MTCSCIDTPIVPGDITTLSRFPTEVQTHIFAHLMADLCQSHLAKLICLSRTIYLHNVGSLYEKVVLDEANTDMFFEGLYDLRPYTPIIRADCHIITSTPYPLPHKLRLIQNCSTFCIKSAPALARMLDVKREWLNSAPWADEGRLRPDLAPLPSLSLRPRVEPPHRLLGGTKEVSLSAATMSGILQKEAAWASRLEKAENRYSRGFLFDGDNIHNTHINFYFPSDVPAPPSFNRGRMFEALFRITTEMPDITMHNVELRTLAWMPSSARMRDLLCILPQDREMNDEERIEELVKFYGMTHGESYDDYGLIPFENPEAIKIENYYPFPQQDTVVATCPTARQQSSARSSGTSLKDRTHKALVDAFPFAMDEWEGDYFQILPTPFEPRSDRSFELGAKVRKSIKWKETEREFESEESSRERYNQEQQLLKEPGMEKRLVLEEVLSNSPTRLPELFPYPQEANRLFGNTAEVYLSSAVMSDILREEDTWLALLEASRTDLDHIDQYGWVFDGDSDSHDTRITPPIPSNMPGPPTPERAELFEALYRATSNMLTITLLNVPLGAVSLPRLETCADLIDGFLGDFPPHFSIKHLSGIPQGAGGIHSPSKSQQYRPLAVLNGPIIDRTHAALLAAFSAYNRNDRDFTIGSYSPPSLMLGEYQQKSIKWLETEKDCVTKAYHERNRLR
ncbi:hypothetical protein IAR50_002614 [Cryptococcus sp. DSM 104548]